MTEENNEIARAVLRILTRDETRDVVKDAIKESLQEYVAKFGWFSIRTIFMALAGVIGYAYGKSHGWQWP